MSVRVLQFPSGELHQGFQNTDMDNVDGADGANLLASLGLGRGEAAEVLHQHLMTRRRRLLRPSGPATPSELARVLRTYATRKAAFSELLRQGKLPPRQTDAP